MLGRALDLSQRQSRPGDARAEPKPLQPLGFIGKPFLPAEVLEAVERAVKKCRRDGLSVR